MKIILRIYFLTLLLLLKEVSAGEILGIGTPYLPQSIDLVETDDLVSSIILANTETFLNYEEKNSSNIFKPLKVFRINTTDKTIWDLEYNENQNLAKNVQFNFNTIKTTIDFIKQHEKINHSISHELKSSLNNIADISYFETVDGFISRYTLNSQDPLFLTSLSKIPVLNTKNAEILSNEIDKGTNLPTYGRFEIAEANPETHYLLIKNQDYGLGTDATSISKVSIKKYADSESRLRAIRSGSIAILIAPTISEVNDAANDPTLEVVESPFSKKTLKIDVDSNETFDLSHIIIRKSLNPDKNFTNFFELHGLSKSVL